MICRPISTYPVSETRHRRRAPFRATPGRTMNELEYELNRIGAKDVVLEIDVREQDISVRTGWPMANARPASPRVVLSFTHPDQGGVRYPCDTFDSWEGNMRAITLALEALRAVSRYGVVRKGEQYVGWKALPANTTAVMTTQAAMAILVARDPTSAMVTSDIAVKMQAEALKDRAKARDIYLRAARATHPDTGGETGQFQQVQSAREVLGKHFGASL